MSNESNTPSRHLTVRNFFRILIVGFTWVVISLKPDSVLGFFQATGIAAIASLYEYVTLFLDNGEDKLRRFLYMIGMTASAIYFLGTIAASFGLITFNLKQLTFSLGDRVPLRHPDHVVWSFYTTVWPMYIFPCLVAIEPWLKRWTASNRGVGSKAA